MPRHFVKGANVFDTAVERMRVLFDEGHRVTVSCSAGKDSGVCVEVCLIAMKLAGKGNGGLDKLWVVMRDEEIMYPGTFEYAERLANRPEIEFHWLIANQPITNVFNRSNPYWWTFDPTLDPEKWVRLPPTNIPRPVEYIRANQIQAINNIDRFPPPPCVRNDISAKVGYKDAKDGLATYQILGLRAAESVRRLLGVFSAKGYRGDTVWPHKNMAGAFPIYDWNDSDIWKAIADNKWDYNSAYDVMNRMGVPRRSLRIAPPTLNQASIRYLSVAQKAWPIWFDKVCKRLQGVRSAAQFGPRSCNPNRRLGETWEQCFYRECLTDAPDWIAERAATLMNQKVRRHATHSTAPFPESKGCYECTAANSWKSLAYVLYNGDPFCLSQSELPYVEPDFFRPGAGTWGGGKPTWTG